VRQSDVQRSEHEKLKGRRGRATILGTAGLIGFIGAADHWPKPKVVLLVLLGGVGVICALSALLLCAPWNRRPPV
jgi:hypothetical protein